MMTNIPISIVIVTKNEAANLPRCIAALEGFDDIVVVDSNSTDGTQDIAKSFNIRFENFTWNGQYPKKRQWTLNNINLKYDFVFFVDADEVLTPELRDELLKLQWDKAGYFVKGAYVVDGKVLKFGLSNNKLCLFDKRYFEFPVVDDLDIDGMGEIEGHYQPVLKRGGRGMKIGQLKAPLHHHAMEDMAWWTARHDGYATWQAGVSAKGVMPEDPELFRKFLKKKFVNSPLFPAVFKTYVWVFRLGFLDARKNAIIMREKLKYYSKIK